MCPIKCYACEAERKDPSVRIPLNAHPCYRREMATIGKQDTIFADQIPMGSDEGKVRITLEERTRPLQGTGPDPMRYALTDLWPYHKRIKPIRELATPHLRNIVTLYDREPERYEKVAKEEGATEAAQLRVRVTNCRAELLRRDNQLRDKVYHMRIRTEGMVKKVSRGGFYYDPAEAHSVFSAVTTLLEDVEHALSKVDDNATR